MKNNMITIVVIDPNPKAPPCVVQSLRSVGLHVEVTTWCGQAGPLPKPGVYQVPERSMCPKCETKIAEYSKASGA